MTGNEREEKNIEWLKTVKVGDEVCITNTYNLTGCILGKMFENSFGHLFGGSKYKDEGQTDEICEITTIRGILPDGCFVVGTSIYTPKGKLEGDNIASSTEPELFEPTEELRQLAWKFKFSKDVKKIDFRGFTEESVKGLIQIINNEIHRINEEAKEKNEAEQEEKKKKEEKKATQANSSPLLSNEIRISSTDIHSSIIEPLELTTRSFCSQTCANYEPKEGG